VLFGKGNVRSFEASRLFWRRFFMHRRRPERSFRPQVICSQGSSFLAAPGFEAESLWDSPKDGHGGITEKGLQLITVHIKDGALNNFSELPGECGGENFTADQKRLQPPQNISISFIQQQHAGH